MTNFIHLHLIYLDICVVKFYVQFFFFLVLNLENNGKNDVMMKMISVMEIELGYLMDEFSLIHDSKIEGEI
jgi:hypothetical protein